MSDLKDALIYTAIKTQQFDETNMRIPTLKNTTGGNASFLDVDTKTSEYKADTSLTSAFTHFKTAVGVSTSVSGDAKTELNKLIDNTTIKRACCIRKDTDDKTGYKVDVKLPYVEDIVSKTQISQSTKDIWKKLGYMIKEVIVPKTMCNSIDGVDYTGELKTDGSTHQCDKFMTSYCENSKWLYEQDVSANNFNQSDFIFSTPECGCYIDRPINFNSNVQPTCYAGTMCTNAPYKDSDTRKNGACKINQCKTIMNLGDWDATMGASITDNKFNVIQNCFKARDELIIVLNSLDCRVDTIGNADNWILVTKQLRHR